MERTANMSKKNKIINLFFSLSILFVLFFSIVSANTETEKLLQEIIEQKGDQTNIYTYINMGNFYFSLNLYEPALEEYEKALNLDEKNILANLNHSYALYKIGEKESALSKLSQITIDDPNNAIAYYLKGKIYKETLQYDVAIAEYEKVIELVPQNDKIICELAQLYQDNDYLIEATETYMKLGKIKPGPYLLDNFLAYKEGASCYLNLGDYYNSIGNIEKAVAAYTKTTKFDEDKKSIALAYYRLGLINLKDEKFEQAIKEKVLSQSTYPLRMKEFTFDNFAQAFIEIGDMHYNAGNLQKAYKNYELAIQLADSDYISSEAHYKLGLTYYRSEDYENALREGDTALSLNPDFLSDQERLIDLLIANSWSIITKNK